MSISLSVLKIAGHSMPGMLALCYGTRIRMQEIIFMVTCAVVVVHRESKRKGNYGPRSLQMENSFRESLISSSFDEDGYEARGRLTLQLKVY